MRLKAAARVHFTLPRKGRHGLCRRLPCDDSCQGGRASVPQPALSASNAGPEGLGFLHATLRDDGVGYGDCLEQITYLIFLKMADEYSRPPYSRNIGVPAEYAWPKLRALTAPRSKPIT